MSQKLEDINIELEDHADQPQKDYKMEKLANTDSKMVSIEEQYGDDFPQKPDEANEQFDAVKRKTENLYQYAKDKLGNKVIFAGVGIICLSFILIIIIFHNESWTETMLDIRYT